MSLEFITRELKDSDVELYRDKGFVIFGQVVSDESLSLLRSESERLWAAANKAFDGSASWNQNALLNGVHKESLLFRQVMYGSSLVDAMTNVIGSNIKAASNQLVYKHPHDSRPYDWHQDNGFGPLDPFTTVSCWMALDKVTEANGCLWVIPGSHRSGRLEHREARGRERIASVADESKAIPVLLEPGESVFFHGDLLHKSNGNQTDRVRRAYFFRYADADAIEVLTGEPRIGKLLRGTSRFPEVTNCPDDVCQPEKNDPIKAAV